MEEGLPLEEISAEDITTAARDQLDMRIEIAPEALVAALDPSACARERLQEGSSAPEQVDRLLVDCASTIAEYRRWSSSEGQRLQAAEKRLLEAASRRAS
jgi:hypothetical protein